MYNHGPMRDTNSDSKAAVSIASATQHLAITVGGDPTTLSMITTQGPAQTHPTPPITTQTPHPSSHLPYLRNQGLPPPNQMIAKNSNPPHFKWQYDTERGGLKVEDGNGLVEI